jgi:hypothetical protein
MDREPYFPISATESPTSGYEFQQQRDESKGDKTL